VETLRAAFSHPTPSLSVDQQSITTRRPSRSDSSKASTSTANDSNSRSNPATPSNSAWSTMTTETESEIAVGYIRLSQDGKSLARQRRDVEDYANEYGAELVTVYNEANEAPGSIPTPRGSPLLSPREPRTRCRTGAGRAGA